MEMTYIVEPRDSEPYDAALYPVAVSTQQTSAVQFKDTSYQLSWQVSTSAENTMELTMSAVDTKWLAFGLGTGMSGADICVGVYSAAKNTYTLTARYASGHLKPTSKA